MFGWLLIFQHASISLFPKEPQTLGQTTPSVGLCLVSLFFFFFFKPVCYQILQNDSSPAPSGVTARQVSHHAEVVSRNFKFPNSSVDVEGADNHPHSSVPPSPHPLDLLLPPHNSLHSTVPTRMCFLMMVYTGSLVAYIRFILSCLTVYPISSGLCCECGLLL